MKLPAPRQILLAFLLVISASCAGCNRRPDGTSVAKPSPEEKFQRILESFRHKVEDQPIGFVVSGGGSRSTMIGTNKVSYELAPPAAAAGQYKAVITVESQSRYSLRRAKAQADEREREQNEKNQNKNALAKPGDPKRVDGLDPNLAGKGGNETSALAPKSKPADEETVTRQKDEQVRKFDLVYDNDRWSLLTKLDPKTEKSIQFAFDEALSRQ